MLVSTFYIITGINAETMKTQILFVFTCAVTEAVNQKDEQESDSYDLRHDGGALALFMTKCSNYSNSDNYIPALKVHIHVGLQSLVYGQISLDMSQRGFFCSLLIISHGCIPKKCDGHGDNAYLHTQTGIQIHKNMTKKMG